jgi:hypothetical protein
MITEARRRASELGVPVSFDIGDAQQFSLEDGTRRAAGVYDRCGGR